jgi:hypothetical protein
MVEGSESTKADRKYKASFEEISKKKQNIKEM